MLTDQAIKAAIHLIKIPRVQGEAFTIGGLPYLVALVYALLFAVSLCVYGTMWGNAPFMQDDSYEYQKVAKDLLAFRFTELPWRTPGYPILLLWLSVAVVKNNLFAVYRALRGFYW